jgi:IS30 family transposase
MERISSASKIGKHKHISERDRYLLEGYLGSGLSVREISQKLNSHISTIYREVKRGQVKRISSELEEYWVYRANAAQYSYETKVTKRRHSLKIEKYKELAGYIQGKIIEEKYSPDAVIGRLKYERLNFTGSICTKTLYNYIGKGIFKDIINADLWEKCKRRRRKYRYIRRVCLKNTQARSIEDRPEEINKRSEYGHWEGDCILGRRKSKKDALFTLSERLSREQIVMKINSSTQEAVLKALNKLETSYGRSFQKKFKSITLDNGREFLDWEGIERSSLNSKRRTLVYFAHPYSAWERGTNENQNRMIRRFVPKGTDISKLSDKDVEEIQEWMNNYPRRILGYKTPNELALNAANNSKF